MTDLTPAQMRSAIVWDRDAGGESVLLFAVSEARPQYEPLGFIEMGGRWFATETNGDEQTPSMWWNPPVGNPTGEAR